MTNVTRAVRLFAVLSIVFIAFPAICPAQVSGGGVGTTTGAQSNPKVEINREPVLTVNVKEDLVEILPGGIRPMGMGGGTVGLAVGRTSESGFTVRGVLSVILLAKLVQLDANGMSFEITVTDRDTGRILVSKALALKNYEEGIVELAADVAGSGRVAVRLLPTIQVKDPVQDYPALVKSFGSMSVDSMVIKNFKELLLRGGAASSISDINGKRIQFASFQSPDRPSTSFLPSVPGAVLAGYIQGKKLIFEWNGDAYEWISSDQPFLPDGKWAVYVWQADPAPAPTVSMGALSSDPDNLAEYVAKYRDRIKKW